MKNFTLSLLAAMLFCSTSTFAQMPAAITITPANATAYDELTITFDPADACHESGSLSGAPSVSMHSGVIPINGSPTNWMHVVEYNGTGNNGMSPVLNDNGDGTYSITFIPFQYYGFPNGTIITHIVAVFNNGNDWTTDGRDYDSNGSSCIDFVIPLSYTTTAPSLLFNVNMNKQIDDGNFDPITGSVYAMIQGMDSLLLTNNTGNIYSGEITTGLTDGQLIDFHFRMDNTDENVTRNITLSLGQNVVDVWFNDITLMPLTLHCNMAYYIAEGWFDPSTDFVDVAGSFNQWDGGNHHLNDTDGDYTYSITIDGIDAGIQEFKFRINGSWDDATAEFPNSGPNRIIMLQEGGFEYQSIYNNYQPGAMPVLFICHMDYQIAAGHFDPANDFLGLSGTFNNWTTDLQLADRDGQMAYTLSIPIDISTSANIDFQFNINGNTVTTESFIRNFSVLDTAGGGVENVIDVWYNNANPTVGAAPMVYDVMLDGLLEVGETVTASYTYEDVNGDLEGETSFRWAIADDTLGTNLMVINDGPSNSYLIDQADYDKYIFLDIRPASQTISGSDSANTMFGDTVQIIHGPIFQTSIESEKIEHIEIYPNPTSGQVQINQLYKIDEIVILSIDGKIIQSISVEGENSINMDTSTLPQGVYFLNFNNPIHQFSRKLIKL